MGGAWILFWWLNDSGGPSGTGVPMGPIFNSPLIRPQVGSILSRVNNPPVIRPANGSIAGNVGNGFMDVNN